MSGRGRSLFPMLSVADLDRSLALYGDVLGGAETYRFPPEGSPEFVVLRIGSSDVGLAKMGSAAPLHGRPLRPAAGHRVELCVYVDDVDEAVEVLRAIGSPIVFEPADQPWGERVAYVEDPDGNLVMLTR
ncbi:MAG TPA: VOC family protein [Patescibacteria group bacterium]|nr:VOC family protein [Patescibacteria group bacterium]